MKPIKHIELQAKKMRISQAELARRAGMMPSALNKIIHDNQKLTDEELVSLVRATEGVLILQYPEENIEIVLKQVLLV